MREAPRILLVSADMGAGHHATARAVEQAARRVWPGCDTRWVDALKGAIPERYGRIAARVV